mgnify:CR=1 FL=1
MISILIPCYNYDVIELIQTLHKQINIIKKKFEIICVEDGSTNTFLNINIKKLTHVKYIQLNKNIGRSKIRNFLAKEAKFNWLLFIDCDSKIENNNFLANYIKCTSTQNIVTYGETVYQDKKPKKEKTLHWKYGKKIETKKKKNIFSSHHFLIYKQAFEKIKFNEDIKYYGHEDTIFWIDLKNENYKFKFIKNPLTHIGLETNEIFIKKTKDALINLYLLNKKYDLNSISIIKTQKKISRFLSAELILYIFNLTKKHILKNLVSSNPSIILFQFYKLGCYFELIKDD